MKDVDNATVGDDVEAINNSMQKLFESAGPVFAKKQAAEQAKNDPNADQTVDAEFTEVDNNEDK